MTPRLADLRMAYTGSNARKLGFDRLPAAEAIAHAIPVSSCVVEVIRIKKDPFVGWPSVSWSRTEAP